MKKLRCNVYWSHQLECKFRDIPGGSIATNGQNGCASRLSLPWICVASLAAPGKKRRRLNWRWNTWCGIYLAETYIDVELAHDFQIIFLYRNTIGFRGVYLYPVVCPKFCWNQRIPQNFGDGFGSRNTPCIDDFQRFTPQICKYIILYVHIKLNMLPREEMRRAHLSCLGDQRN